MVTTHTCEHCGQVRRKPEVNDGDVGSRIRVDELVRLEGHGSQLFRVMKVSGMGVELEAVL